eukprot:TRINITY_DN3059_c0_g1_i1.p1 TRINITY_DN3059_c0_g1~~TRINITY_DN3059_c0_g1_i1.p1  ORF type:complete len:89 (-),score=14.62 TRINITY_DN3059_c0_g1_i1:94-360(-)
MSSLFGITDLDYKKARNYKDAKWEIKLRKSPVLILVEGLGKEGAKTQSEIELAFGLNEAKFPYHLQAIDLYNNGHGINERTSMDENCA